jgi:deoxyribodipyrimidine photo-lyase
MRTIIIWFRNDLRVHDHPALHAALHDADTVIPVFVLDTTLLQGERQSANRNRFLLQSLADLRQSLRDRDGELYIRQGDAAQILTDLATQHHADAVYCTADYTGYARRRDKQVQAQLKKSGITMQAYGGRLANDQAFSLQTGGKAPFKVFTPFWRQWSKLPQRAVLAAPRQVAVPGKLAAGDIPAIGSLAPPGQLASDALEGGETAGRARLKAFIAKGVERYADANNDLGADATSRLSSYLHFGCLSAREVLDRLPSGAGADAFARQLVWRDFYNYVLLHFPDNAKQEFQERYRTMDWQYDKRLFAAWQDGKTGYPVVDAAMRQLRQEGWMHNRARLIVGSFLTKDLGIDWRWGERYFMQQLIDGDQANNNGNWQWIASVGVDPAPVFRRLYNPASQAKSYDPQGVYVRRYVPELSRVPDEYIGEPWRMPDDIQQQSGCHIGTDYPAPIVDHAAARSAALERYRSQA